MTFQGLAGHVAAAVDAERGAGGVHLLGHSMGGMVALELAAIRINQIGEGANEGAIGDMRHVGGNEILPAIGGAVTLPDGVPSTVVVERPKNKDHGKGKRRKR